VEINLSTASRELFIALVNDAGNWSGQPMIGRGSNIPTNLQARGNITDLKKKELIATFKDRGDMFVHFTDNGKSLASAMGLQL
jgi:hypothetical protein